MPTTAEKKRTSSLLKAIDSILGQSEVKAVPFVIVNGNRFDKNFNKQLKERTDIKYAYLEVGNQTKAVHWGVKNMDTPYFSFLDDDDIYLDDALITRLEPMLKDSDIGLSVTRGYKYGIGDEFLLPFNDKEYSSGPIAALLKSPWLSSCSGLYKKSLIPDSIFEHNYRYLEWTYLAYIISGITKIAFIDKPTFLINFSENSLSSSPLMEVTRSKLMEEIARNHPNKHIKKLFLNKKYAAYHMASVIYLSEHEIFKAWKYHLLCLISVNGIKYITYTYQLCRSSLFSNNKTC